MKEKWWDEKLANCINNDLIFGFKYMAVISNANWIKIPKNRV